MRGYAAASLLIVALLAAVAWYFWRRAEVKRHSQRHISVTGGEAMSVRLPDLGRTFLQRDPQWENEPLGSSSETIGNVGCTLCSVAMAATSLGYTVTPVELNARLRDASGYTETGWLIWGVLPKVTEGEIEAAITSTPAHADIDAALRRGEYPIVKIFLPFGIPHWVVVLGKEGQEYLVRDPAKDSTEPIKLSDRADAIYSVRIIRRKAG